MRVTRFSGLLPSSTASRGGSVPRFPAADPAEAQKQPIVRYITDGHPTTPPDGTTMAQDLAFPQSGPDRMTLLFYPDPSRADITELGEAWDLHPVLLEDLLLGHQRPKIDRYGDVLFMVVRSARYIDSIEEVDFAEFHLLMRPGTVALLCQDGRWIDGSAAPNLDEDHPLTAFRPDPSGISSDNLLQLGPEAVMYRILDQIVDGYLPVLRGLTLDKEQIERQVFSGDAAAAERVYRLSQEVIDTQQSLTSIDDIIDSLRDGFDKYDIPDDLRAYLDDVSDHLTRARSRISDLREALSQILEVNSILVAQRQNEDMKKISAWAAILFAPTLIGAIYGMNFDNMPELHWKYGYPFSLALMVALGAGLYVWFKRSKWM